MFFRKKIKISSLIPLISGFKKGNVYFGSFLVILVFYLFGQFSNSNEEELATKRLLLKSYNKDLERNTNALELDSVIRHKERSKLIHAIENKIVGYLYQIPDYSYMASLEMYLKYSPKLLEQIPSVVPLEKSHFYVSSTYGYRQHPIAHTRKKHCGIDLAAAKDSPVYAAASGNVQEVIEDSNGYGTHIIIKHRFGFQTLYGHLHTVLVSKGQSIIQHDLIATVGQTGNTTGYHLHYEVIKNKVKIDPGQSLNLKRKIYLDLLATKTDTINNNKMKI